MGMMRRGVLLVLLCLAALTAAQVDDDVSAAYDYDGTLILDSRNFRGMTSTGIWVVFFYSYSVVLKDAQEAYDCQSFSYMWGEMADDLTSLGGTPSSGPKPTIHVAKYDTSDSSERAFVGSLIGRNRIERLPAVFLFDGENVVKLPDSEMAKVCANFPDIDQLQGYAPDLECDPPAEHYEAMARNEENMKRVIDWMNDYLVLAHKSTIDEGLSASPVRIKDEPGVDFDYDFYDPTEEVIEKAREATRSGDISSLHTLLARMKAVNGTGIDCRDSLTFQTPLHFATLSGETEVAETLIAAGADIEAACKAGDTPLTKAAETGRRGVLRALIKAGAVLGAPRRDDGATALHMAALTGRGDICLTLVRAGADVEARTPRGLSPLHFAAMGGHSGTNNAIDALLTAGADIDGADYQGLTALMHASYTNNPEAMELLCERGASLKAEDLNGDTALHHAMHNGIERQVRILLKYGADVFAENRGGEKAKDCLACWDNWEQDAATGEVRFTADAKRKFDRILRPHVAWWWPGFYVVPFMRTDFERKIRLLEARVGQWLVGRVKRIGAYLRRGGPFFQQHLGDGGMFVSQYQRFTQKRVTEIEEFYDMQTPGGDHQGDVWLYDMGGKDFERMKSYSELQRAVVTGQGWLVERLLREGGARYNQIGGLESDLSMTLVPSTGGGLDEEEDGDVRQDPGDVDIEVRDENSSTPLMVAASRGDVAVVEILARYGADVDAADEFGLTALMRACRTGDAKLVACLLTAGAEVDRSTAAGGRQTAVMMAAAGGHLSLVEMLVERGADVDRRDDGGRTTLNHAFAAGAGSVVDWLKSIGATMQQEGGGGSRGFLPKVTLGDYNPADDPEMDLRNPRFTGSLG